MKEINAFQVKIYFVLAIIFLAIIAFGYRAIKSWQSRNDVINEVVVPDLSVNAPPDAGATPPDIGEPSEITGNDNFTDPQVSQPEWQSPEIGPTTAPDNDWEPDVTMPEDQQTNFDYPQDQTIEEIPEETSE